MSGPGRRSGSGPGRIRGPWPRPPAGWSACPGWTCLGGSAWLPSGRVRRALAVCTRIAGLARRSGPTGTHRLARRHGSARTRRIARRHATARRRVIARPRWRTAVLGVGHPARARSARSRRVASSLRLSGSLRVTRSRRIGSSGGIGRPRRVSRTRRVRRARRIPGSRHAPGFLRTGSPWRVTAPGGIRRPLRVGRSGGVGGSGGVGRSGWVRGPRRVSRPGRRSRPSGDRGPRAAGPGSRAAGRRPWAAGSRIGGVTWHVEQAARRVDGRGVQHLLFAKACGGAASWLTVAAPGTRLAPSVPVAVGRPGALLTGRVARRGPVPREQEDHQDDQAERHARRGHAHADSGDMADWVAGEQPYCRAHDHEENAEHDRDGARDRQGNDKPYPPGGGGVRAHCSTIASRLLPRKPYGQVRWL